MIRETEWPPEFEKQIDLSKVSESKLILKATVSYDKSNNWCSQKDLSLGKGSVLYFGHLQEVN